MSRWNYIDESGESKWVFECREQSEDSLEKLSSTEVTFTYWGSYFIGLVGWWVGGRDMKCRIHKL